MNINNLKKYILIQYYNHYDCDDIVFGWKIMETFDTLKEISLYQIKYSKTNKYNYRVMKSINVSVSFKELE